MNNIDMKININIKNSHCVYFLPSIFFFPFVCELHPSTRAVVMPAMAKSEREIGKERSG